MLNRTLLISTIFLLTACEEPQKADQLEYFDFSAMWNGQVDSLNAQQEEFLKMANLDGNVDSLKFSSLNWQQELEVFKEADINKSAYRGAYNETKSDSLITYHLKEEFDHPVKEISISLNKGKPVYYKAKVINKNFLYESFRELQAYFEDGRLTSYQVQGTQELFVGSRKSFDVKVSRL